MGILINPKNFKEIDTEIKPLIELLNKYGLKTRACCCGHKNRKAYISFDMSNVEFLINSDHFSIHWDFSI